MFPTSTQYKHWQFNSEKELYNIRQATNIKYVQDHGSHIQESERYKFYLTPEEEKVLVSRYEFHLRDFCKKFQPPLPNCVIGTSYHYFKRFYLHNSVIDHHPKEIMVTCVYLACKVEEFYVPIQQFVLNVKGDRTRAMDIIINNELLLIEQLHFHLTIHNPFRPVEGLLIDIKTRSPMYTPDRLRPGIDQFLERIFLTDAILLYTPSQIALAAVLHAASKLQENLDSYVTETLLGESSEENLKVLIGAVRAIRSMERVVDIVPDRTVITLLEKKLEQCRNPENNPDSEIYKNRYQLSDDTEDDIVPALPFSELKDYVQGGARD